MSRFSPQGRVQNNSGEIIGQAIAQALGGIGARRRQDQLLDRADADKQRQTAIQDATLARDGIHLQQPGALPPQFDINVSGGPSGDDIISRAINPEAHGAAAQPLSASPSRNLSFGQGYYVDQDEKAGNAAQDSRAHLSAMLAEALGKAKIDETVNPGGRDLKRKLTESEITKNLRDPNTKPIAQQHVVDPVTGEVKFFDPSKPPSDLRVNPAPRPVSFTPVTLGGDNGTPAVVRPFNNRTGEVGTTIGNAKPATPLIGRQPTEIQSRARLVVPRAEAAAAELDRFFQSGAPVKSEIGKIPLLGNFALDKDEQMMNQAAETIASSILRLESGANYTKNEMLSYKKQFLPAPGDSPEVLAQKRATLQEQLRSMRELADRGARSPAAPVSEPAAPVSEPAAPAQPVGGDTSGHTMGGKPSLADRVKQLKAQGVDKATAKATLKAEGYAVPE